MSEEPSLAAIAGPLEAKQIAGAPFGIEVDADLTRGFTPEEQMALRRLYRRDGLLLFRGQDLTMDQQLDACAIFGPVMRGSRENYLVSNVHEDGLLGDRELLFHNDVPYVPAPYLGGSLHAIDVDEGVSATRFASGMTGYERLPASLKARVDGRLALHIKGRGIGQRTRLTDLSPGDNCAVHELVGRQQETGRPYVFACVEMTGLVIGLPEPESEALLEELFGHLYQPEAVYEHHWQVGDIVIWDNLAVQHARSRIAGGRRTLQRVTIAELGYWEQYPADLPTYDLLRENRAA